MILHQKMLGSWLKANRVEVMTSGLIIGADAINVIPTHIGTHFLRSCLRSGTDTHSQTGSTSPIDHANRYASSGCLGMILCMRSGVIQTWIRLAITVPKNTKGNASSTILTNKIANELIMTWIQCEEIRS